MVRAHHTSYNGGAEGAIARLAELSKHKVGVGVPSSKTRDREYGEDEESGITNAELVYIHTHGIRKKKVRAQMQPMLDSGMKYSVALQLYIHSHGSAIYQSPPRPIIEPAIKKNKKDIAQLMRGAAKSAMKDQNFMKKLKAVGIFARNAVRDYFENGNDWAPNAPSTIKRKKGGDRPLIDTGAMRQAISYVIDNGGEAGD
jgi:hypothetical protein